MTRLIPLLAVLICVAACRKNSSSKRNLVGKWNQIAYFDASAGGCNCWKTVDEIQAEKIEFTINGTFQRTPPLHMSFRYCPGEYRVIEDTTLGTTMICMWTGPGPTVPPPAEETHWFSKQGNLLIIEWRGSMGGNHKIRYKKED